MPRLPAALRAGLFAASALASSSCGYVDRRLVDLHDCFVYRWHQDSLGLGADVRAGPLSLGVGGWASEWGVGKDTWWQKPGDTMTNHGNGVPITTIGPFVYGQDWPLLLATGTTGNNVRAPDAYDDVTSWVLLHDVFDLDDGSPFRLTPTQRAIDLFGVEVGLAPVFWQVHVGFNFAEFADFALGFLFLDLFGDDYVERPPTLPFVPAERRASPARR